MNKDFETSGKEKKIRDILRSFKQGTVAFSGGVDSSLLLYEAAEVIGKENVLAITLCSDAFPLDETHEAESICKNLGVKQILLNIDVMSVKEFRENAKDRCYYCK